MKRFTRLLLFLFMSPAASDLGGRILRFLGVDEPWEAAFLASCWIFLRCGLPDQGTDCSRLPCPHLTALGKEKLRVWLQARVEGIAERKPPGKSCELWPRGSVPGRSKVRGRLERLAYAFMPVMKTGNRVSNLGRPHLVSLRCPAWWPLHLGGLCFCRNAVDTTRHGPLCPISTRSEMGGSSRWRNLGNLPAAGIGTTGRRARTRLETHLR